MNVGIIHIFQFIPDMHMRVNFQEPEKEFHERCQVKKYRVRYALLKRKVFPHSVLRRSLYFDWHLLDTPAVFYRHLTVVAETLVCEGHKRVHLV